MNEKKIVIKIDNTGKCEAETFGVYGNECISELDKLLKDLSLVSTTSKKDEFYKEGRILNVGIKANNS